MGKVNNGGGGGGDDDDDKKRKKFFRNADYLAGSSQKPY